MYPSDSTAGQEKHRSPSLVTLCIACGIVALSAGAFVLPDLRSTDDSSAPSMRAPLEPAAASDLAPAAVISPEENLSASDRELLAFRPHGG